MHISVMSQYDILPVNNIPEMEWVQYKMYSSMSTITIEHAWVRVLRKQMYSSTITLQYTRVRVRLLYNVIMITFMITLMNILFLT